MVRMQVQFTEAQAATLRELAAKERLSVAEVVRRAVDRQIASRLEPPEAELRRRALEVVGKYDSGLGDLAEQHDDYLAEAE